MAERDRRLGERLAQLRRRRGMTQEALAERSAVSVSVIRKLEQGERDSAGLSTLRKLASALDVPTMELFAPAPAFAGPVDEYERDDLYDLRRVLQPPRGVDGASVLSLAEDDGLPGGLAESLRIADVLFRDDDFTAVAAVLPTLITQARVAVAESGQGQRLSAWAQLAQTYLLAASLLTQLRKDDLAYQTLGLALDAATQVEDPGLVGSVIGGETWLLMRQGRLNDAIEVALNASVRLEPSFAHADRRHLSSWGWLNLGIAGAAARNNQLDLMTDAMRRASAAAARIAVDGPGNQLWSSFGPSVIAMRQTEMAVVTGDPITALRIAQRVVTPPRPANTYHRFRLDMASALLELRQQQEALAVLLALRSIAPNWLRHQRYAKSITSSLLRSAKRTIPQELRDLADFLHVDL
ncbi:MAG: helix-turn-helix domain-containing protein [Pseudonocardiaceae bacterium]